jgi:murein L,D-transpeptidase YafK
MADAMRRLGWLGLVGVLAAGCAVAPHGAWWPWTIDWDRLAPPRRTGASKPTSAATDDQEHLSWLENEPLFIVVRKGCRTLDVYDHGNRVRSFAAVFGIGGSNDKVYEGDRRTPDGLYAIIEKRPNPRWHWFFLLDYPNRTDYEHYARAVERGDVPEGAGVGGAVGIHGTDKPDLNEHGIDWTWGCVSVDNDAIDDLDEIVPVGTMVLIED